MKRIFFPFQSIRLFAGTAVSAIFIFLPVAFLGLDLEDRGYHIYEQLQSVNTFGAPNKMIFLTNLVGGYWLKIVNFRYLYAWSICGGLILAGINIGLAALIAKELFKIPEKKIYRYCLIGSICAVNWQGFFLIDYYTLPLLTTELYLLFFLKARHSTNTKKTISNYVLAGCFAGLTPFLRLPTVYLFFAPIIYEMLVKFFGQKRNHSVIFFYLAAITTIVICYLLVSRYWLNFPEYSIAVQGLGKSPRELLKMPYFYLIECWSKIPLAIAILSVFALTKKTNFLQNKLIMYGCFSLLLASGIVYLFWSYGQNGSYWGISPLMRYHNILEAMPFALIIALLIPSKIENTDPAFLHFPRDEVRLQILMICGVFILYPFGTNTGLMKILYGFPVLLPVCFIIWENYFKGMHRTFKSILVFFIILGALLTGSATYCDANRWKCRTMLKSPNLEFIFSSQQKAYLTDSLISEIKTRTVPNEEILLWGFDYTLLISANCRSWCNIGYNSHNVALSMFQRYCSTKRLPNLVVANTKDKHYQSFGETFLNKYYIQTFQKGHYLIWIKKTSTTHCI